MVHGWPWIVAPGVTGLGRIGVIEGKNVRLNLTAVIPVVDDESGFCITGR
jgi:hypothetical protein